MLLLTSTMTLFCSTVPVNHDRVTESQHEQKQASESEADGFSAHLFHYDFISTVTCRDDFSEKASFQGT